jgi:acyl-CoA synthetase (AMP-forming)/AMP-acid ligase II
VPIEARAGLDLSHLRQALVGAEPVLPDTLAAFAQAYAPAGFRPEAFRPVYGLAEATLAVAFGPAGGARIDWVSRKELGEQGRARSEKRNGASTRGVVCVGAVVAGHELRITTASGSPCGQRELGEIWFRGPSLMDNYFNNPQATCEVKHDGWLRTGDLGYLVDDLLHVAGRSKELVIKAGCNHLPADIEAACEDDPAVRRGRVVAFGIANSQTGTEDLVVVAEARHRRWINDPQVVDRLTALVVERAGIRPDRVQVVGPGSLSKTSSGKLQRAKVRAAYEQGVALRPASDTRWYDHPALDLIKGRAWALAGIGRCKAREWLNWR